MASKALDKKGTSSSTGAGKVDWRDVVRNAADTVTGDSKNPQKVAPRGSAAAPRPAEAATSTTSVSAEDRAAIARYQYLVKTAEPQQLELVHRDAFARLTPAQRDEVNSHLRAELPAGEHPASTSPEDLARSATRGEAHNPGFLSKLFAKSAGRGAAGTRAGAGVAAVAGAGLGAAGGLLAAVAGGAVLSSVAAPLLEQAAGLGVDFDTLAGGLEGGLDGITGGLEGVAGGAGEYVTGLGEQATELGSNFELPGLSELGKLFGRE